jgi:hypothetical protein
MALKFRRGSTADKSGSLSFGEPYVNTTLTTLQVGGASGDITFTTQGNTSEHIALSVSASSFISASKLHITGDGEIKGNLVLGGNITVGDANSDTINVVANLSSSLIPQTTNAFDLGSVTKAWKDLYISTASIKIVDTSTNTIVGTLTSNASGDLNLSGQLSASSIAGFGVVQTYSSSVNSKIDAIHSTTASLNSRVGSLETKSGSIEQSFHTYSGSMNTYTASNNSTNNTQNSRLNSLETESGSVRTAFNSYTSSNDSTNTTQNSRLTSLESNSGSLNTFSASIASAIQLTGSAVTIKGDLLVKGATTTVNSTTVNIEDNIVQLNGSSVSNGGIQVLDSTSGETGSLLWDNTNNYWKGGPINNEDRIILAAEYNAYTSSNNNNHESQSSQLTAIQNTTASLNSYTASNNTNISLHTNRLSALEATTQSLNDFSSSINSYTASNNSTNSTQNGRLDSLETESGSIRGTFNTFTSSATSRLSSLESESGSIRNAFNAYTSSNDSTNTTQNNRLTSLEVSTGSINTYTASNDSKIGAIHTATASLNTYTSSQNTYNSGINSYTASNNTNISAIHTATASLNTFTSSINTTIKSKLNTEGVVSGSSQITLSSTTGYSTFSASIATMNDSTNTTLSSSIAVTDLAQNNRLDTIESRYATTGSNSFIGNQNITGSLYISQDLIVYGSSSITYVTSSQLNVQTSYISVNVNEPSERFGGLKVYDSGSSNATASLAWDSLNNRWIYQNASGSSYSGAMLIMGPRNTGSLGDEIALTSGKIARSAGGDHIVDSIISEVGGNAIGISGSLVVTGSIVASGTSLVSGSSQVSTGIYAGVSGDITIASNGVATIAADSVALGTDTTGNYVASLVAGSGITLSNNSGEGATPTIALTNNAITIAGQSTALGGTITAATIGAAIGAFSGSSQIDHNSTTNYDANKHVDHTSVSISAGLGLSGGGTIAATRTLSIDTAITATVTGSQTLTNKTISGGSNTLSNIANSSLTNSSITIAGASTALGGTISATTIANAIPSSTITNAQLVNSSITIAGASTALGSSVTAATIGNAIGAFSGSSQVDATATTNWASGIKTQLNTNTVVSGSSQIDATATTNWASGIKTQLNSNTVISGSSQVTGIGNSQLTNSSVTVTAGTGLSGGGAVSLGSSVTLSNAGVTSNVAGTGVTVSGATGAVTISIGQAVATSSNVQFNSLGVGMAASATAGRIDATNDVVAYSSSDRRFKDNIKPIENPLEKISKISGNTFDWKEENKIEHGYEGNDVGVIAQEIEAVLPQLVQTRESGYKAVKYDKLVALLIEGIKEQQIQINDMKVEIENLKKQKGL